MRRMRRTGSSRRSGRKLASWRSASWVESGCKISTLQRLASANESRQRDERVPAMRANSQSQQGVLLRSNTVSFSIVYASVSCDSTNQSVTATPAKAKKTHHKDLDEVLQDRLDTLALPRHIHQRCPRPRAVRRRCAEQIGPEDDGEVRAAHLVDAFA